MCLVGYPLLVMEIGIGQKLRHNSITIWTSINPQLGGIGIVICLVTIAMTCYYGIIVSWVSKYMLDVVEVINFNLFNIKLKCLCWAQIQKMLKDRKNTQIHIQYQPDIKIH